MLKLKRAALIAAGITLSTTAPAQVFSVDPAFQPSVMLTTQQAGFDTYKAYLLTRARSVGIKETTLQTYVPSLQLNTRAIELDRAQAPSSVVGSRPSSLLPYVRKHVTPSLTWRGQSRYHSLWSDLFRIQSTYGVDAATLLSIYGKETSFGAVTGNFDLLEALASLAFEGRRRTLFETEFLSTLKLIDAGVPRNTLRGSYAGATGYPQFMPSVVLRLRADGNGDGVADIWSNEVDALASIANYLKSAGWKRGVPWGAVAKVPSTLDRASLRPLPVLSNCSALRRHSGELTVAEWRALGVETEASLPGTEMATLFEPLGTGEASYLLTGNYQVLLNYNCSNYYGITVALLSDAIARR